MLAASVSACGSDDPSSFAPEGDAGLEGQPALAPPADSGPADAGAPDLSGLECLAPGEYDASVTVDGVEHPFQIHIPQAASEDAALIVQLHGGGSTGAAMDAVTQLTTLAAEEGFVVITPEGYPIPGLGSQIWNGGGCCGPPALAKPDHVRAIDAILDRVLELGACVDEARMFATGHSNGAIMAYRLACELADRIAAVAISAGSLADETESGETIFACEPSQPVSVLQVHGLQDACLPYEGGQVASSANHVRSVESSIDLWRDINGCDAGTDTRTGEVRRRTWSCTRGTAMELITVDSLGHPWAGSPIYGNPARCGGSTTTAVSTTEELWRFFEAHSRR